MAELTVPAEVDVSVVPRVPSLARRIATPLLKALLALAIAASMGYAVVSQWHEVRATWLGLAWQSVVLSFAAAIAGMLANVMAWRASLRDLEHDASFVVAARINFVGALGKYLPGSVWAYVMQMEFGRRAGLPRARAFLASIIAVGLATTAALIAGVVALPSLLHGTGEAQYGSSIRFALYVLIPLLPTALICATPAVLTRLIQLVLRILRRPPLTHKLSWSGVLAVIGWSGVAWVCFGVHFWLLANAQAAPGPAGLVRLTGAFAIAMTVGLFAIFAPSGLGIREAVLVAALVPVLPRAGAFGVALGIALASRMLFIVADLAAAGAATVAGWFADRSAKAGGAAADSAGPAAS